MAIKCARDQRDDHRRREHGPRNRNAPGRRRPRLRDLDRDPEQARALSEELGGSATALDPDARFGGDVVVVAVYYPAIKDAVRQYGDRLADKVVVDITDPIDTETRDRLATTRARRRRKRWHSWFRPGRQW